jgi:hypothetical protein
MKNIFFFLSVSHRKNFPGVGDHAQSMFQGIRRLSKQKTGSRKPNFDMLPIQDTTFPQWQRTLKKHIKIGYTTFTTHFRRRYILDADCGEVRIGIANFQASITTSILRPKKERGVNRMLVSPTAFWRKKPAKKSKT